MVMKQKKGQTVLYALVVFVAVVLLFCFAVFDFRNVSEDFALFDNPVIYWILRGLSFVFFFFAVAGDVYLLKQLFSKEPLVEVCDEYFYDNSSAISLGRILWSDMEQVYVKGGFLNIKLKNPEVYFAKKNRFQMQMIQANLKLGYGDVCLSPQRFKKDRGRFFDEFSKRMTVGQEGGVR